jgi:hypothetical protein
MPQRKMFDYKGGVNEVVTPFGGQSKVNQITPPIDDEEITEFDKDEKGLPKSYDIGGVKFLHGVKKKGGKPVGESWQKVDDLTSPQSSMLNPMRVKERLIKTVNDEVQPYLVSLKAVKTIRTAVKEGGTVGRGAAPTLIAVMTEGSSRISDRDRAAYDKFGGLSNIIQQGVKDLESGNYTTQNVKYLMDYTDKLEKLNKEELDLRYRDRAAHYGQAYSEIGLDENKLYEMFTKQFGGEQGTVSGGYQSLSEEELFSKAKSKDPEAIKEAKRRGLLK